MATVPTPRTWSLNEDVTSAHMNSGITDPLTFLLNRPHAHLRRTTTQSIANAGTGTAIDFTTEDVDSAGGHDNVTNPSRYTAVYAGWYECSGGATYVANASFRRGLWWRVNGTDVPASAAMIQTTGANPVSVVARTVQVYLNVGDYVQLIAYQESGGALNISGTTFEQPSMTVTFVSN